MRPRRPTDAPAAGGARTPLTLLRNLLFVFVLSSSESSSESRVNMGAVGTPIAVKDAATLTAELTRVADICHGCRRCFTLCPSFEVLFKGLDVPEVDGEADKLPRRVLEDFVDLCYECKLCLPHCPYIPPHRWGVDVPHLVLDARRVRMETRGSLPLRERLISDPDALGRPRHGRARRELRERPSARAVGDGEDRRHLREEGPAALRLADVHALVRTREARRRTAPASAKVVLFPTCSVEWNRPEIGKAAVAVLEHNGVEVAVAYPQCCGMPLFDVGDVAGADEARRTFVSAMKGWVEKGYTIVTPGPSCSLMVKKEYPWLAERERGAGRGHGSRREEHAGPLRVPRRAQGEGPPRARLPEGAEVRRIPPAVPPQGPEHGLQVARPPRSHRRRGHDGREVLRPRRDVGDEGRVLRRVHEGRHRSSSTALPRPAPRSSPPTALSRAYRSTRGCTSRSSTPSKS